MGAERRAQAIATAPRRKRYDDDDKEEEDDDEQKKSRKIFQKKFFFLDHFFVALLGYIKTSALPIPISIESQHPHSLSHTQSGPSLLPTFRVDPPSQDNCGQLDYTFNHNLRRNRCPSAPLPGRNEDWKN